MELLIQAFIFPVKRVAELFKKDESICVEPGMLAFRHDFVENLVDICHIEIAAEQHVARAPVVATHERMNIVYSGPSGCAVA